MCVGPVRPAPGGEAERNPGIAVKGPAGSGSDQLCPGHRRRHQRPGRPAALHAPHPAAAGPGDRHRPVRRPRRREIPRAGQLAPVPGQRPHAALEEFRRPTTANTSRLNRRRLHQLCGPGCTLASPPTASCRSSSPSRSDSREQRMTAFNPGAAGQGQCVRSSIVLPMLHSRHVEVTAVWPDSALQPGPAASQEANRHGCAIPPNPFIAASTAICGATWQSARQRA